MDYVLRFENSTHHCWVDLSIDGDPGRSCCIETATKFETENLARENKQWIESKYRIKLLIDSQGYAATHDSRRRKQK